ncbi:sulfur carrier protein ThiS [Campylobacter sp. faydin G-24]|uniref:Sulfur carrier protein ThiS n=1 Tax=Campylobacter anatolicus TaxID=2829105 RepID=A0ABS5HI77_9BACT|nr:sulfur carrier protein ThiS [Campylobacter anatolicus]MBR8462879.1 sulfur carrier protein ThiS [Campylobacter anatolicus]MBR8463953.1 sulfur carrier protein ThiS [Campylobacter anatolicus]MBR8465900.1 sulfur carrier protein ThiS [Campylobacter anatolicus]
MINFRLNGESVELENDVSVSEFLSTQGYELKFIALERDGQILTKMQWQVAMMSEGKSYEVVEFVGGG